MQKNKIAIVGGCGHVGIPLGLVFAFKGFEVFLVDKNEEAVNKINQKILPFKENGAQEILDHVGGKTLKAMTDPSIIQEVDYVFFVTGTLVDEHHNPRVQDVVQVIQSYMKFLTPHQLIILRSTIYPGVVDLIDDMLKKDLGESRQLAFCPERITQGNGIEEILKLPQLISGTTKKAIKEVKELFSKISPKTIELSPREAEIGKLILNSWRYIEFAIANQFYTMVESNGLSFYRLYDALKDGYPRASYLPTPGLSAGPCLLKDTMQLSSFYKNNFFLGQVGMLINEGLPNFLVEQLEEKIGKFQSKKIGLLGMTFKANSDDTRNSLSFKLKKILEFKGAHVLWYDPYLKDSSTLEEVLTKAEGMILATPHDEFKALKIDKPHVDCWGMWRK